MPSFQIYSHRTAASSFPLHRYLLHTHDYLSFKNPSFNSTFLCQGSQWLCVFPCHLSFKELKYLANIIFGIIITILGLYESSFPWSLLLQMLISDLWIGKLRSWKFTGTAISFPFNVPSTLQLLAVFWGPLQPLCTMKPSLNSVVMIRSAA